MVFGDITLNVDAPILRKDAPPGALTVSPQVCAPVLLLLFAHTCWLVSRPCVVNVDVDVGVVRV